MMGKGSRDWEGKKDLSQVLHLNRARFQAAVWRATALCVVGRRGKRRKTQAQQQMEEQEQKAAKLSAAVEMPWLCVAGDSRAGSGQ